MTGLRLRVLPLLVVLFAGLGALRGAATVSTHVPPVLRRSVFALVFLFDVALIARGVRDVAERIRTADSADHAVRALAAVNAIHRNWDGHCVACSAVARAEVPFPCQTRRVQEDRHV